MRSCSVCAVNHAATSPATAFMPSCSSAPAAAPATAPGGPATAVPSAAPAAIPSAPTPDVIILVRASSAPPFSCIPVLIMRSLHPATVTSRKSRIGTMRLSTPDEPMVEVPGLILRASNLLATKRQSLVTLRRRSLWAFTCGFSPTLCRDGRRTDEPARSRSRPARGLFA